MRTIWAKSKFKQGEKNKSRNENSEPNLPKAQTLQSPKKTLYKKRSWNSTSGKPTEIETTTESFGRKKILSI